MNQHILRRAVLLGLIAASACTMKDQETPALTGPSEFGTAVTITVSPDVITQDGLSQSVVTATVRGPNGEPLPNVALRAEIRVNGVSTDFGGLSSRNLVTGSDGRAQLVYTAPVTPFGLAIDTNTVVDIGITPVGTDAGNATTRFASIRLVPPGRIQSPNNLLIAFDPAGTTASTAVDTPATFRVIFRTADGLPPPGVTVLRYLWSFGDGSTATTSLASTSHNYVTPGSYTVTVTVEDIIGLTGTASISVNVAGPPIPTADFTISPGSPAPGQEVRFNASLSKPSPGRTIVSYEWDFGNGATGTGIVATTTYGAVGAYMVNLKVTDDRGRIHVVNKPVTVAPPPAAPPTPLTVR